MPPASGWCRPPFTIVRCPSTPASASMCASLSPASRDTRASASFPDAPFGRRNPPMPRPATRSHIRCMASIATWSWSRPFSRTPPSSSSAPGASPVTPAHWHFSSHNSGEQSRHAGAHRFRGIRRRTRYPGALAQCRPAPLVPRKRPPSRAAYDADEHRPLQRARRRVASLHHLLTRAEFSNSFTTFVILNVNEVE